MPCGNMQARFRGRTPLLNEARSPITSKKIDACASPPIWLHWPWTTPPRSCGSRDERKAIDGHVRRASIFHQQLGKPFKKKQQDGTCFSSPVWSGKGIADVYRHRRTRPNSKEQAYLVRNLGTVSQTVCRTDLSNDACPGFAEAVISQAVGSVVEGLQRRPSFPREMGPAYPTWIV